MKKTTQCERLQTVLDLSWELVYRSILSGRLEINKESSLQLHLSRTIFDLGNLYCTEPGECFKIEMESNYEGKSIDITCSLGDTSAALELKCFIKASNRAADLDMYDVLKDIERLESYSVFNIRKFICLTDNKYYPHTEQRGYGKSVTLKNGTTYTAGQKIIPAWTGIWKVNRDKEIILTNELVCDWVSDEIWHFLYLNIK